MSVIGIGRGVTQRVGHSGDVAVLVVLVNRRVAEAIGNRLVIGGEIMSERDGLAVGIGRADQAAIRIVVVGDWSDAAGIGDGQQAVSGIVREGRGVADGVGEADQVAGGVDVVGHHVAVRVGDLCYAAL